jgi:D-3-phosphoglycerate dehydrogenase
MKLIVCDPTAPDAVEAMQEAGIEVDVRDDITIEELMEVIADYDAMVVRSRTKVREPLIDKAENLDVIIRAGVGLDSIDVEYARSKGIDVRNTPMASTNAVAELTVGYLFALARQIPQVVASMKNANWEKKTYSKGTELAGKTLGIIGCGRIGTSVGQKAAALGMRVLGCDPYVEHFDSCMLGTDQDEVLVEADFISLHVPYTKETHHVICAETFDQMKDGVYVVNCGRGGTVDEEALYNAIVSGKVAGAALDVFEDEKEDRGQRLMELPQVIGSPHIGAGTVEAKRRVGEEVVRIAVEYLDK